MDKVLTEELEALNQTTQEILQKSDRVRAVLLGAQLDRLVQNLLEAYLLPRKGKKDRLLEGSGPVGTFTSRIELAERLGLLRPEWYHDLQILNRIRDDFAHGLAGLTLNNQPFVNLCNELEIGRKWIEHGRKLEENSCDNPQTRFVATAIVLSAHLCLARTKLDRLPEVWKTYPEDAVTVGNNNSTSV